MFPMMLDSKPGSIVPGLGEGLHGLLDNLKLSPIHLG